MGESKVKREPHLTRERGRSEWEHGEERVDITVKEDRFQGGEGGQENKSMSE